MGSEKIFNNYLNTVSFLALRKDRLDIIFNSLAYENYYLCDLKTKEWWPLKHRNDGNIWRIQPFPTRCISFSFSSYTGSYHYPWDTYLLTWFLLHKEFLFEYDNFGRADRSLGNIRY